MQAADEKVRATGTAFSVEILQGEVQVVLYQGHVAITRQVSGATAPQPLRLASRAGPTGPSAASGDAVGTPVGACAAAELVTIDPLKSLAWEEGQLVFDEEPLALAVDRVNRYTDHKLTLGDAKVAALRVDGVFTAGDTDAFVEGITDVFPVRVRYRSDGETLVSR